MDIERIQGFKLTQDRQNAVNIAIDIADAVTTQSLDLAKELIGNSDSVRGDILVLATAHMQIALMSYAVHELSAVLREFAPEIAGAISEAGTDIGAGIFEGFQHAARSPGEKVA